MSRRYYYVMAFQCDPSGQVIYEFFKVIFFYQKLEVFWGFFIHSITIFFKKLLVVVIYCSNEC